MEVVTIDSAAFQQFMAHVANINKRIDNLEASPTERWLDNQEVIELLHISKRTLQYYRDSGQLSFSQIKSKIYYKLSDVHLFLEDHYNKGFKK